MARVIVEEREFKDRDTQVVTNYTYFAIKGGKSGKEYEVPLKSLTGAEKTALQMIADLEGTTANDLVSRPANTEEKNDFFNKNHDDSKIDLND